MHQIRQLLRGLFFIVLSFIFRTFFLARASWLFTYYLFSGLVIIPAILCMVEKKKDVILTLLLIFADATGGKYPAFFKFFPVKKNDNDYFR